MNLQLSPCITFSRIYDTYLKYKQLGICPAVFNEGSARSAKTWDFFAFIVAYCFENQDKKRLIYFVRGTTVDALGSTKNDFDEFINHNNISAKWNGQRSSYTLFGNNVKFMGVDNIKKVEGLRSDIMYFNEMLDIPKSVYNALIMRCTDIVVGDWNPKYTQHWAFKLEGQPHTYFFHTTFKDNQFLSSSIRNRILSWEPTQYNIDNNTADEWRWKVYGLGIRAAQEGLVFPNITYVEKAPDYVSDTIWGLDFGFTNDPTSLVKCDVVIKPTGKHDIYLDLRLYEPIDEPMRLAYLIKQQGDENNNIWSDTADQYGDCQSFVTEIRNAGVLTLRKATKGKGSILNGINNLKMFNIHIVNNSRIHQNAVDEANGYVWDKINGIEINKPVDKFNHFWDAARYVANMELSRIIQNNY